jgi:hypothetical protein
MRGHTSTLAGLVVGAVLSILAGCQMAKAHGVSESPHFEIALDISVPMLAPCESGGGLALDLMKSSAADKWSTLTVVVSGDGRTLNEPVEIFRKEGLRRTRAMETAVSSEKKLRAVAADIVEKCRELPRTEISPVTLMSRRAVENLRSRGCKDGTNCSLLLVTDGYDNAESAVRHTLADPRRDIALKPLIDNSGISVSIYGLAETTGEGDRKQGRIASRRHNVQSADRVATVLRRLFTHPELVSLHPYSPKFALEGENATTGPRGER